MNSFGLRLERQSETQRSMDREAPRYPSQGPELIKMSKLSILNIRHLRVEGILDIFKINLLLLFLFL